jgi:3',5'-cyclic AMP phosphodiesterase CpdA
MLLAYHGKPELKQQVLAEMREHRKADRLIKGWYWQDGKGCAVGCLLKSRNHIEYEEKFGIPVHLAYLEDSLFEGLRKEKAMLWPERFLDAFEPGKNYSKVWHKFAAWLLVNHDYGIIKYATQREVEAITNVANLHQKAANGIVVTQKDWGKAADAAFAAGNVYVATYAAIAVYDGAAAARAVDVAADDAAAYAAHVDGADAYELMSNKLIEIIKGE